MSLTMNNVITTIYMQTYASIYMQFWLGAEVPVILKIFLPSTALSDFSPQWLWITLLTR